jgi:hypothetical protein
VSFGKLTQPIHGAQRKLNFANPLQQPAFVIKVTTADEASRTAKLLCNDVDAPLLPHYLAVALLPDGKRYGKLQLPEQTHVSKTRAWWKLEEGRSLVASWDGKEQGQEQGQEPPETALAAIWMCAGISFSRVPSDVKPRIFSDAVAHLRSLDQAGWVHGDTRLPNLLWFEKLNKFLFIDFEFAVETQDGVGNVDVLLSARKDCMVPGMKHSEWTAMHDAMMFALSVNHNLG